MAALGVILLIPVPWVGSPFFKPHGWVMVVFEVCLSRCLSSGCCCASAPQCQELAGLFPWWSPKGFSHIHLPVVLIVVRHDFSCACLGWPGPATPCAGVTPTRAIRLLLLHLTLLFGARWIIPVG